MRKYILLMIIIPVFALARSNDFATVNFGYVQSHNENWDTGFGGHVEIGSNRWGLRAHYTRVTLDSEIKDLLILAGTTDIEDYSTQFGLLLMRKIHLVDQNDFFKMSIGLGAGPGFYEKKVEIENDFLSLLTDYEIEVTDIGVTGLTGVTGLDIGIGPLATSCSYYFFKGLYKGDQFERRIVVTLGFSL